MFGNYQIESGNYLFTLYNLINKKFTVQKGGTITWSGDPFAAELDLVARYTDLSTSVANFIQEYLVNASADLQNQASNSTDVDLTMNLQGPLLEPEINFDLAFPNLRQELQSYTESKLRILKQDQNELNKQVFSLIVAGQFLPSDFALEGSKVIYNTVSEFVSNQLSLLLTELFSEFIGEGEVISGIDFDIAYNQYQQVDLGDGQNFNRGDELEVSLRQDFFNDRFSIEVGGAFGMNGNVQTASTTSGTFVGNDLVFTYILNKDRSLKLQVYQRLEPDNIAGRKLQVGAGLSFQKEFNSFGEFIRGFTKAGGNSGN
ncbi:MAG: translocation/assembly module TamB domain-containing protein [Saprospiraceae bacterium]|nr:translocation/assembly module TamB domain-containing protein [Saprospiraceae bacterium]